MSEEPILLQFQWTPTERSDKRTFKIYRIDNDPSSATIEIYRFYHPVTGLTTGLTTFQRQNLVTGVFETGGQIEWLSNSNATVHFGLDETHIRELRRQKKPNSQTRRFKVGGNEYKWKIAENDTDLLCVDSRNKWIATWIEAESRLSVSPKVEEMLDRLVVTCFLNQWVRELGRW